LRVNIKNEQSHKFAIYWVAACVAVHAFAMQCEEDERSDDEDDAIVDMDPFIAEGLLSSSDSDDNANRLPENRRPTGTRLQAGKEFRRQLKDSLFRAKERRAQWRARRRPI